MLYIYVVIKYTSAGVTEEREAITVDCYGKLNYHFPHRDFMEDLKICS
jgi:hypothetical protein